jgi:hypothetical protein
LRPGEAKLRFGAHRGERLADVSVEYLAELRKAPWLQARTRKEIESWLRLLIREPGQARLAFGKHEGEPLAQVDGGYLDWALGQDWLGKATRWLIGKELGRREGFVLLYDDPVSGRPVGKARVLAEVEDRPEPGEPRPFVPSEGFGGGRKKPSLWSVRRPPAQVQADEEADGQVWFHDPAGQTLLWPEGLHEPPAGVARDRRDRNAVLRAAFAQGEEEAGRSYAWDRTLELVDQVGRAGDEGELEMLHDRAARAVRALAAAEGWDAESNALRDELDEARRCRWEQLARREEVFTDCARRVDPVEGRGRRRRGPDMEPARVHELVRRMRGCRTEGDLLEVAGHIRRHASEFTEPALAKLRAWYAHFRAELAKGV